MDAFQQLRDEMHKTDEKRDRQHKGDGFDSGSSGFDAYAAAS